MNRALLDRAAVLAVMTLALLAPASARADAGDTNDIRVLEKQLEEEHAALSTADCNAACRALMSIRRAADKICALEPGPRCDAARLKAADATKRVREVCPACVIAGILPEPAPEPPQVARAHESVTRAAPAERGGCRSCAVPGSAGGGGPADLALIGLGVLAAAKLLGRSKKDRRDV